MTFWPSIVDLLYEERLSRGYRYNQGVKQAAISAAKEATDLGQRDNAVADIISQKFDEFEIRPGIQMPWGTVVLP